MSENKTGTDGVDTFLAPLDATRRADAEGLVELMAATTGQPAVLWCRRWRCRGLGGPR